MNNSIQQKVKQILSKFIHEPAEQIQDELLISTIDLTAYDQLELLYDLEDYFQIDFPVSIINTGFENEIHRIEDLINYVKSLIVKKTKAA